MERREACLLPPMEVEPVRHHLTAGELPPAAAAAPLADHPAPASMNMQSPRAPTPHHLPIQALMQMTLDDIIAHNRSSARLPRRQQQQLSPQAPPQGPRSTIVCCGLGPERPNRRHRRRRRGGRRGRRNNPNGITSVQSPSFMCEAGKQSTSYGRPPHRHTLHCRPRRRDQDWWRSRWHPQSATSRSSLAARFTPTKRLYICNLGPEVGDSQIQVLIQRMGSSISSYRVDAVGCLASRIAITHLDSIDFQREIFSTLGELKECTVHFDSEQNPKGTAMVEYRLERDALAAAQRLHRTRLFGKRIEVIPVSELN